MKKILAEEDLIEKNERNIFIIDVIKIGRRVRIVGIDIFTGVVVNIVDHNNAVYGLHSYSDKIIKIKNMVIKAKVSLCNVNTFMFKNEYEILGESSLRQLNRKILSIFGRDLTTDFDEIKILTEKYHNACIFFLVKFTGSTLQKYNEIYQLKMQKDFINLRVVGIESKEGLVYKGIALITGKQNANGVVKYYIDSIFGDFNESEEKDEYSSLTKFEKRKIINQMKVELDSDSLAYEESPIGYDFNEIDGEGYEIVFPEGEMELSLRDKEDLCPDGYIFDEMNSEDYYDLLISEEEEAMSWMTEEDNDVRVGYVAWKYNPENYNDPSIWEQEKEKPMLTKEELIEKYKRELRWKGIEHEEKKLKKRVIRKKDFKIEDVYDDRFAIDFSEKKKEIDDSFEAIIDDSDLPF